jgi:hypothetical protein
LEYCAQFIHQPLNDSTAMLLVKLETHSDHTHLLQNELIFNFKEFGETICNRTQAFMKPSTSTEEFVKHILIFIKGNF